MLSLRCAHVGFDVLLLEYLHVHSDKFCEPLLRLLVLEKLLCRCAGPFCTESDLDARSQRIAVRPCTEFHVRCYVLYGVFVLVVTEEKVQLGICCVVCDWSAYCG